MGILMIAVRVWFTLFAPDTTLDINVHDTYFIIAYAHIFQILGTWLILCGLGYWVLTLLKIRFINWMFWLHALCSFLLSLTLIPNWYGPAPEMEYFDAWVVMNALGFFGLVFFLFGQVIYVLNLLISAVRRKKVE